MGQRTGAKDDQLGQKTTKHPAFRPRRSSRAPVSSNRSCHGLRSGALLRLGAVPSGRIDLDRRATSRSLGRRPRFSPACRSRLARTALGALDGHRCDPRRTPCPATALPRPRQPAFRPSGDTIQRAVPCSARREMHASDAARCTSAPARRPRRCPRDGRTLVRCCASWRMTPGSASRRRPSGGGPRYL